MAPSSEIVCNGFILLEIRGPYKGPMVLVLKLIWLQYSLWLWKAVGSLTLRIIIRQGCLYGAL